MEWNMDHVEQIANMFDMDNEDVQGLTNFGLDITHDEIEDFRDVIRDFEYDIDDTDIDYVKVNFDNPESFLSAVDLYDETFGLQPTDFSYDN